MHGHINVKFGNELPT